MDAMTPLTVTLPMLDVDWETLVSVNLPTLLFVIVGVPLALVGYIVGLDVLVRRLPKRSQPSVRPWVWVAPAIFFVGLILVYPMVGTVVRSFFDRRGDAFVGLGNFVRLLTDHGVLIVLRNNLLWLLLYPGLVLLFGLLLAVLSDRVKFEKPVKSLILSRKSVSPIRPRFGSPRANDKARFVACLTETCAGLGGSNGSTIASTSAGRCA